MSATNYFTRVDSFEGASGGTSAVAPLMTALVTVGTNAIKDTVQGYQAGPGWDACTGLGTPDFTAILNKL